MKKSWMRALAERYDQACQRYSGDTLLLLCNIDGTILDMRHTVLVVLQSFDRAHGTRYFERLTVAAITTHENFVGDVLKDCNVPTERHDEIVEYYLGQRWLSQSLRESAQPFDGALETIRWFQIQPNTAVALVTDRPESLREDTLSSLSALGKRYRVTFKSDLLFMNRGTYSEEQAAEVKVAGLRHFLDAGYDVFAFIDNEPSNLKAIAASKLAPEALLLHADTIFKSPSKRAPRGAVRGKHYRIDDLIPSESVLPRGVQLVWHGVNDEANLRQFLGSKVHWAEVDVRLEPSHADLILRHDTFADTPLRADETPLLLADAVEQLKAAGRAIKLDLKGGRPLLDRVLDLVSDETFLGDDLWYNSAIGDLGEEGFRCLSAERPDATIQCPIDFLSPLIQAVPTKAHEILEMFRTWGITRFSLSWERRDLKGADLHDIFEQVVDWGYEINIYNVGNLEAFLQAVILLPRSVTSDYNFPKWRYYGQGSGRSGQQFDYQLRSPTDAKGSPGDRRSGSG